MKRRWPVAEIAEIRIESGFIKTLQAIAAENDKRRRHDEDVPWTWEQWDRMIESGNLCGVPAYLRHSFNRTKERVAKAKADGVTPEFFHRAMNLIAKRSYPKAIFR